MIDDFAIKHRHKFSQALMALVIFETAEKQQHRFHLPLFINFVFVLCQGVHKHRKIFLSHNFCQIRPKLKNYFLDGFMFVEQDASDFTNLLHAHQPWCVKTLDHLATLFNNFTVLVCLKYRLKKLFILQPLLKKLTGKTVNSGLSRVDYLLVKLLDLCDSA